MKIFILMVLMVFAFAQSQAQCDKKGKMKTEKTNANKNKPMSDEKTKFENLPDGAKLTDEVREIVKDEDDKIISDEIIKVEQKLRKIGAKYDDGKLIDADGRAIKFYKPPIRGISQGFEEDRKQAERDQKELEKLKKDFTVITLYVNPLKVM